MLGLGRKSNKPEIGEITINGFYDEDNCTSSEGEKIILAWIDTPEIRGKKSKTNRSHRCKKIF